MSSDEPCRAPSHPSFREALKFWLKLGFISFGGPAGQIATMHQELVERRRWISPGHFLHALNFCMLLPGPEAQQLATYLGWRLHGWRGGVVAGALFVLPAAVILLGLSWLYVEGAEMPWLAALFHGLMPAVIAVVADAVMRIGGRTLNSVFLKAVAVAAFVAIWFFKVPFLGVLAVVALLGVVVFAVAPDQVKAGGHGASGREVEGEGYLQLPPVGVATRGRVWRVVLCCGVLWWLPVVMAGLVLGKDSVVVAQGLFFSKAAMVTFGGAYAVLPYVAQQAVETHGWLTLPQMMSGLALAESTPGPLIMVLQFVGFVGGWQHPGGLGAPVAAVVGAAMTTWCTFLPSFLMVFLGAPHVEGLRSRPRVGAVLTAISAAVVGVIVTLGLKFAIHALWASEGEGLDGFVAFMMVPAFIALRRKVGVVPVLGGCAIAGWLWWLI